MPFIDSERSQYHLFNQISQDLKVKWFGPYSGNEIKQIVDTLEFINDYLTSFSSIVEINWLKTLHSSINKNVQKHVCIYIRQNCFT